MNTVVHVGCPKTGTTSLQKFTFPAIADVAYVGKYNEEGYPAKTTFEAIRGNGDIEAERERFEDLCDRRSERSVLYSIEGLTNSHLADQSLIARRTREVFGDATILLTVRRQQDIAVSQYFNFVAKGYELSFDQFMERGLDTLDRTEADEEGIETTNVYRREPGLIWSIWQYAALVDVWADNFPEVVVVPLEAWKASPELTRQTLADTLAVEASAVELPEKKARSRISNIRFRKYVPGLSKLLKEGWVPSWLDEYFREKHLDVELTDEQLTTIEETYGPQNRTLDDRTDFDLQTLSYPGWGTERT